VLHIHRAERADRLADGLAETLLEPLDDPFISDVVAVRTRGIERWLAQRLSTRLGASDGHGDGVCANVKFPFPGRLVLGVLAAATGADPNDDPWLAERSVWPLLEVVDACLEEPWLCTLAAHLTGTRADDDDSTRRFAVVRHIADLFDRYGVHRPDMIRSWAEGGGTGDADTDWQAELWRRLRMRIDQPSPAERLAKACERIRTDPDVCELPPRLALFGLTRIPRSYLDVLAALAEHRDVHLFVLHPSPSLWRSVAETRTQREPIVRRRSDPTAFLATNRLLASWGRDVRELQLVLQRAADSLDHHHPLDARPQTLLGRIQDDVRQDRQPPGAPLPGDRDERPPLDPGDNSVQIHACHGRVRQVEVLRDTLLHVLEEDPTLEPRDVIVMCPDIETFAPLIHATFGAGQVVADDDTDDSDAAITATQSLPDLRVRLADRSLRQTNPVLSVVSQLLELADQRATASQLLDLADREPVRRRFDFDDDALARMQEWVAASGIRWGLDAEHRAPFKLGELSANTWRAGLDRILLGVTMTEEDRRLVKGVLPLDDVDSGVIDLAGRMAEYVDRVKQAVDSLAGPTPIAAWADVIAAAADALADVSERDSWQRTELQRVLEDVVAEATGPLGETTPVLLELADVRALLADRLRGRPTRANFRTGHLTICTLVPMRSVPHRVVCILGVDDGEFPRRTHRDGDDLMLAEPHVGDRDPRSEDRQMLLDALMAATERVIITYTGNDERNNLPRPPAVPVGELMDIVDRTVSTTDGLARDTILIHHPLQPFDPRCFEPGELIPKRPWSFDRVALGGARAISAPRHDARPFLAKPLPTLHQDVISLENLIRFVEHPVRAFLRDRIGVSVREFSDDVDDALPVELDALATWEVGQRVLDGMLQGLDPRSCLLAEVARGSLPPGRLGKLFVDRLWPGVKAIADAALVYEHRPESLEVNLLLDDGRRLSGTVAGVCGQTIRTVSYSRVKPRDRLGGWVRLLALSAARPEVAYESMVIGRARSSARSRADVTTAWIPALAKDPTTRQNLAHQHLAALIDLYDRGMREPLPLACESSAAYASASVAGGAPGIEAGRAWKSPFGFDKEDRDPEHLLVHGGEITIAQLLADEPRPDEQGPGWEAEPTRFGVYALRLWDGLLAREELTDR
jgi:exodeoxyribonuclease V gamma subunit